MRDIKVFGGENRADSVQINNVISINSASNLVQTGIDLEDFIYNHGIETAQKV